MTDKQKKNLIRILVAAVELIILHFVPVKGIWRFMLYLIPYLTVGYDVLIKALKGIKNRQPFDENLLMAIATIGAFALALMGKGEFTEAVAVMLFYQVGEWFQSYAVGKSRRNISELMDIRPDYANVEEDGTLVRKDPDEIGIGTVIVVQPGEKIPIDGIVRSGQAQLDTAALTGESLPRQVKEGDEVVSGCINMSGVLHIETTCEFGESTVSRILELMEDASSLKSRSEEFITRFSRVYTPVVVCCAIALALLPPLWLQFVMHQPPAWQEWIYRALTFLVISCPCALVISIPLSFFAGIGGAGSQGVLVKGSSFLEALASAGIIVFDKTGTLTKGVFAVSEVHHNRLSREELLYYAAHAEIASSHPISLSLKQAYGKEPDRAVVSDIQEISGHGVTATVQGHKVAVGNERLMSGEGMEPIHCHSVGTVIHIGIDGVYEGHIVISDMVKENSAETIRQLGQMGIRRIVMLTGDSKSAAEQASQQLGIKEVYSELLPADKVAKVEELLTDKKGKEQLVFVGDGINDAPVLSRSDIGVAMGAMGSDAAIEAADVVLMDDDPKKIVKAIRIARKCVRIVYENIWFAIGVKVICLILGALGIADMWLAVFADVGVMIIAVCNAIRALMVKKL